MAEYCEKCLIEILEFTPEQARKAVKDYKKGEQDLCEGCGKIVVMRKGINEKRHSYQTL